MALRSSVLPASGNRRARWSRARPPGRSQSNDVSWRSPSAPGGGRMGQRACRGRSDTAGRRGERAPTHGSINCVHGPPQTIAPRVLSPRHRPRGARFAQQDPRDARRSRGPYRRSRGVPGGHRPRRAHLSRPHCAQRDDVRRARPHVCLLHLRHALVRERGGVGKDPRRGRAHPCAGTDRGAGSDARRAWRRVRTPAMQRAGAVDAGARHHWR